jgi:serine/threonine protein kinase
MIDRFTLGETTMPDRSAVHPPKDELVAFGLGRLEPEAATRVESHLESCAACCETMLDLQDDTFVALVRKSPPQEAEDRASLHATIDTNASAPDDDRTPADLPPELCEHARYEVLELIGRGGMGDVYKAQHKMMHRPVALKVIKPKLVRHDAAVQRFQREVQAAARLHHGNIVTAHDAEQAGELHFLVMEFVDGVGLDEVVRRRGPLPVAEACEYLRQAAAGLQHAHELGMVHRDIKPHNLMLARSGQLKILDFGLAGFASEAASGELHVDGGEAPSAAEASQQLTQLGTMMGTPDYMAPEQAADAHAADIRADIYSLGCTFYTLLTGQAPFAADAALDKIKAHLEQAPPPLADFRDDVPPEVEAILRRMLAKSPAERYQTPAELAAALAAIRPLPQSPKKTAASGSPKRRRYGAPLAIAAALLLLGIFSAFAAVVVVVTDRGALTIQSEVDDVRIVVSQDGKIVQTIDVKTGSQVKWLASGKYQLALVGGDNDVKLDKSGFTLSRFSGVIVTARWNSEGRGVIKAFDTSEPTITRDHVEIDGGGWKLTANETRSFRLFEHPLPNMQPGPIFYRAKLKTENVQGRAYLEMWVRVPGMGEFFSKGFHIALSGDNGWAEYEIPFLLRKGEQPDLVKLNVTVEGSGSVWIKDVELRGRAATRAGRDRHDPNARRKSPILVEPGETFDLKAAIRLLPEAAGVPNNQWGTLAGDIKGPNERAVTGMPLSLLLMTLNPPAAATKNPDVVKDYWYLTEGLPKPADIDRAVQRSKAEGYVSFLQPEYITNVTVDLDGDIARGTIGFVAPKLYSGSVQYAARRTNGEWRIEEFALPNYKITLRRGEDGIWHNAAGASETH